HLGDGSGVGGVLHRVGHDRDALAHLDAGDVQLIHGEGHSEVAQVVDGAQNLVGLSGLAGVVVLIHDGPLDGGGDGVVVQIFVLVFQGDLRIAQALGGALEGVVQV